MMIAIFGGEVVAVSGVDRDSLKSVVGSTVSSTKTVAVGISTVGVLTLGTVTVVVTIPDGVGPTVRSTEPVVVGIAIVGVLASEAGAAVVAISDGMTSSVEAACCPPHARSPPNNRVTKTSV
jgi:hypothetical protein